MRNGIEPRAIPRFISHKSKNPAAEGKGYVHGPGLRHGSLREYGGWRDLLPGYRLLLLLTSLSGHV